MSLDRSFGVDRLYSILILKFFLPFWRFFLISLFSSPVDFCLSDLDCWLELFSASRPVTL